MPDCSNFRSLVNHLASLDTGEPLFIDLPSGREYSSSRFAMETKCRSTALRALGVRQGDSVALLALNSAATLSSTLAIFAIGAVAVPLNARWSDAEQAFALADANVRIVLHDDSLTGPAAKLEALADPDVRFLAIDSLGGSTLDEDHIAAFDADDTIPSHEDDCAIFYTGGTTGRSKGVVHSHGSLLKIGRTMALSGAPLPANTFACCFPHYHIGGAAPILARLFQQSPTVFLPTFDPQLIRRSIVEWGVTELGLAPTMIQLLLDWKDFDPNDFKTLRRFLYGSSPISPALLQQIRLVLPTAKLTQAYGMTEAGVFAFLGARLHDLSPRYDGAAGQVLCPDVTVRIEDAHGREVPQGEMGEIVVYGDTLMSRYHELPDATTEALRNGGYRTGDVGNLDEASVLTIHDRLKDIIISGGENVYSLEVEAALSEHPGIQKAAVIGVPHKIWGESVHAVVVTHENKQLDLNDISGFLREKIAGYKIPRGLTILPDLPMTALGKVAKHELRKLLEITGQDQSR